MLSKEILKAMNKQINMEHFSSNLYLSAGSWCLVNGYDGSGKFLIAHAKEETIHMDKLFNYILETGSQALISQIDKPTQEWGSLKEVFIDTLEHERSVTKSINELVALCFKSNDFSTFNFLQWYVSEQHEEEALFMSIVDKFKLLGEDLKGIYFIDRDISSIQMSTIQNSVE